MLVIRNLCGTSRHTVDDLDARGDTAQIFTFSPMGTRRDAPRSVASTCWRTQLECAPDGATAGGSILSRWIGSPVVVRICHISCQPTSGECMYTLLLCAIFKLLAQVAQIQRPAPYTPICPHERATRRAPIKLLIRGVWHSNLYGPLKTIRLRARVQTALKPQDMPRKRTQPPSGSSSWIWTRRRGHRPIGPSVSAVYYICITCHAM